MHKFILSLFFLVFTQACLLKCDKSHREMSAEDVLEAYLNFAFNIDDVTQKAQLMSYTSGSLKAAIAGASDLTLKEAYINRRYELERFYVLKREDLTPRNVKITYQLVYKELPEGEQNFNLATSVTTENTVLLKREDGAWYIEEVLASSTAVDFPVNPTATITPRTP